AIPGRQAARRGDVRRGGAPRGRRHQPERRPPRRRRLQAGDGPRPGGPRAEHGRVPRQRGEVTMATHKITVTVNGTAHTADIESRLLLVHLLRENLRLTGTHIGCDTTHCGACTVLLDGVPVKSCTVLAVQADGRQVRTVE